MIFANLMIFASRVLLVALFLPFSALDKVLNFDEAIGQAAQAVPKRPIAKALILAGLGIEIFMSLGILSGVADRLAALILALYCIVTAILWKQFWKTPGLRLKGSSRGREVFWDFMKNLALAGGFLMLAFGSNAGGLRVFMSHPFVSSHPYSIAR